MPQRNTARKASLRRSTYSATLRAVRSFAPALALGVAGLTVACADGPTAAAPAPQQAFVPGPHLDVAPAATTVDLAAPEAEVAADQVAAFTVQPGGSTFSVGDAKVVFPAGFVARPTTFTVTRKAGALAGYDFQPSGTFSKPVTVTVKLKSADTPLRAAYVRDWAQVDAAAGTAVVNEFVPTAIDAKGKTATMTLSHFSGYIITTTRKR